MLSAAFVRRVALATLVAEVEVRMMERKRLGFLEKIGVTQNASGQDIRISRQVPQSAFVRSMAVEAALIGGWMLHLCGCARHLHGLVTSEAHGIVTADEQRPDERGRGCMVDMAVEALSFQIGRMTRDAAILGKRVASSSCACFLIVPIKRL